MGRLSEIDSEIRSGIENYSYRSGVLQSVINTAADRLASDRSAASVKAVIEYLRAFSSECDEADVRRRGGDK